MLERRARAGQRARLARRQPEDAHQCLQPTHLLHLLRVGSGLGLGLGFRVRHRARVRARVPLVHRLRVGGRVAHEAGERGGGGARGRLLRLLVSEGAVEQRQQRLVRVGVGALV